MEITEDKELIDFIEEALLALDAVTDMKEEIDVSIIPVLCNEIQQVKTIRQIYNIENIEEKFTLVFDTIKEFIIYQADSTKINNIMSKVVSNISVDYYSIRIEDDKT